MHNGTTLHTKDYLVLEIKKVINISSQAEWRPMNESFFMKRLSVWRLPTHLHKLELIQIYKLVSQICVQPRIKLNK